MLLGLTGLGGAQSELLELQQDRGCRCTIGCGQAALPMHKGNMSQGAQNRRTAEMRRVAASWNACSIMRLTKGKSSLLNLIAFQNGMTCCVDEEGVVRAVCLDFSKVFDTVPSNILMGKHRKHKLILFHAYFLEKMHRPQSSQHRGSGHSVQHKQAFCRGCCENK